MTQNNPIHANSRFSSLWRKELWGYFSKKSKESIREHITLPKYDFLERYYEETKETSLDQRTARDIRKSYYK
jgi:hypothetical protein